MNSGHAQSHFVERKNRLVCSYVVQYGLLNIFIYYISNYAIYIVTELQLNCGASAKSNNSRPFFHLVLRYALLSTAL